MDLDFFWIGLGIAAAGYFIGNGLKNFKNPDDKDSISELFNDDDEHELIKGILESLNSRILFLDYYYAIYIIF